MSNVIFKLVGEPFIVMAGERLVIPTSAGRMLVEGDSVPGSFGRIPVVQAFKCVHCVCSRILRAKKAAELRNKFGVRAEPKREVPNVRNSMTEFHLEPIERSTTEVG